MQVATILLNLFVGPPLFRSAIYTLGEARMSPTALDMEAVGSPRKADPVPRSPSAL